MATTETPGAARPRPWLLVALAATAALAALVWLWPGNPAGEARRPSNPRLPAGAQGMALDPAALDVRLEALEARSSEGPDEGRNPFRFQPAAAPPPANPPVEIRPVPQGPLDTGPPAPPPLPPIPLKFIGTVEPRAGDRVAAFSDCTITTYAREGGVVLGQYRLVRIGVESVVMEYLDGRGRMTIRLQGQECVGK
jgi:hypothetical protein